MSMVIGSKSTDTILDIFKIGIDELIRQQGLPLDLSFKAKGCMMESRGTDMAKRIDVLRIVFPLKEGTDEQAVTDQIEKTGLGCRLQFSNGSCAITVPPFEWRLLPKLVPLDEIIETFAARTLRSQSWELTIKKFKNHDININLCIEIMREKRASDLHLRAGSPPYIRVDNDLFPIEGMPILTADDMRDLVYQLGSKAETDILEAERECSFQYHATGTGYLRVSGYFKQGAMALAIRLIDEDPPDFEAINIPPIIKTICDTHRGLFLVCGITGSGKSTTLAAMVDHINMTRHTHIITIEDPVEYVFKDKKSLISQRQVGRDTHSFGNALRGSLREDPDVIMVGEMRDMETIRSAISAAETGHLVFSTLHTMTAVDTVNRIIGFFPPAERDVVRQQLAFTLRGVICQRLLKKKEGVGRIPCLEILLGNSPLVRDAIMDGEISKLHDIIEVDSEMKTFDQFAVELFQNNIVSKEEAVSACSNLGAFNRIISGIKSSEGRKLLK